MTRKSTHARTRLFLSEVVGSPLWSQPAVLILEVVGRGISLHDEPPRLIDVVQTLLNQRGSPHRRQQPPEAEQLAAAGERVNEPALHVGIRHGCCL